jgi:hypothetical protein
MPPEIREYLRAIGFKTPFPTKSGFVKTWAQQAYTRPKRIQDVLHLSERHGSVPLFLIGGPLPYRRASSGHLSGRCSNLPEIFEV